MRAALLTAILLLSALPVLGQEGARHPIDSALSVCEAANPSTQGMLGCLREAERSWDRELNRCYRALQARVGDAGRPALLKAQKAWMAFRDAEFVRMSSLYAMTDGTMYLVIHAADRVELVRARALELRSACDILDSSGTMEP